MENNIEQFEQETKQEDLQKFDTIIEQTNTKSKCSKCKKLRNPEEYGTKPNGAPYKVCSHCNQNWQSGSDSNTRQQDSPNIPNIQKNDNQGVLQDLPLFTPEETQTLERLAGVEQTDIEQLAQKNQKELSRYQKDLFKKAHTKGVFQRIGKYATHGIVMAGGILEKGLDILPTEDLIGAKLSLRGYKEELKKNKEDINECLSEILAENPRAAEMLNTPFVKLGIIMGESAVNVAVTNLARDNPTFLIQQLQNNNG